MAEPTAGVLKALAQSGLLLNQHTSSPNVVTLVTGEILRTSWWSHPEGRLIYAVLSDLSEHPDVLFTKLLYRKITLVHRDLWPALLSVASGNEAWQLLGLSAAARDLWTKVNKSTVPILAAGRTVKEIEFRLLARTVEVHTESGRHQIALEPWSVWGRRVAVKRLRSSELGRREIETAVSALGIPSSALPWAAT